MAPRSPLAKAAAIAPGAYTFSDIAVSYTFGAQRRASGTLTILNGTYYDGTIRTVTFGSGNTFSPARISILQRLAVEPTISITRVERSAGSFTTRLARAHKHQPLLLASRVSSIVSNGSKRFVLRACCRRPSFKRSGRKIRDIPKFGNDKN